MRTTTAASGFPEPFVTRPVTVAGSWASSDMGATATANKIATSQRNLLITRPPWFLGPRVGTRDEFPFRAGAARQPGGGSRRIPRGPRFPRRERDGKDEGGPFRTEKPGSWRS